MPTRVKYLRFIPLLFFGLNSLAALWLFFDKNGLYYMVAFSNLTLIFSLWFLVRRKSLFRWLGHLILPLIVVNSAIAYFILFPVKLDLYQNLVQAGFILVYGFIYLYLRGVFFSKHLPNLYQEGQLERLSLLGGMSGFFLAAGAIYGLFEFLHLPILVLATILAAITFLLVFQSFFVIGMAFKDDWVYVLALSLAMTEITAILFYLPFNYNAIAFIAAIFYYLGSGAVRNYFAGTLNQRRATRYIFVASITILLIISLTRWM